MVTYEEDKANGIEVGERSDKLEAKRATPTSINFIEVNKLKGERNWGVLWPLETWNEYAGDNGLPLATQAEVEDFGGLGKGVRKDERLHGFGTGCTRLTYEVSQASQKHCVVHDSTNSVLENESETFHLALKKKISVGMKEFTVGKGTEAKKMHALQFGSQRKKLKHDEKGPPADPLDDIAFDAFASSQASSSAPKKRTSVGSSAGAAGTAGPPVKRGKGAAGTNVREKVIYKAETKILQGNQTMRLLASSESARAVTEKHMIGNKTSITECLDSKFVDSYRKLANGSPAPSSDHGMVALADLRSLQESYDQAMPVVGALQCTLPTDEKYTAAHMIKVFRKD
jgi:hypothetical protein